MSGGCQFKMMHILQEVLNTFLEVLTRGICCAIKIPLVGDHFLYSPGLKVKFRGDIVRKN